jgi:hypothetical protein
MSRKAKMHGVKDEDLNGGFVQRLAESIMANGE